MGCPGIQEARSMGRRVSWKWAAAATMTVIIGTGIGAYAVLNSFDYNSLKPTIAKAVKDATGRDLAMGHFNLQIGLTPMLVAENLAFRNPEWAHRISLAHIRRLEIHVDLVPLFFQELVIKRLVLIEPDVQLEISKSGRSNFDFDLPNKKGRDAKPFTKPTKLSHFTFREILLKKVHFTVKRGDSRNPVAILLDSVEVMTTGADAPVRLRIKGSFREKAFLVKAVTGSLEQLLEGEENWPLDATIEALETRTSLRGSIGDLLRIKEANFFLTAEGKTSREIGAFFHLDRLPETGAFNLASRVTFQELGDYSISDLRLNTKGTELRSSFRIRAAGKKPRVTGIFSLQGLDLREFLGKAERPSQNRQCDRIFSDKPLRGDILAALDGEFKILAKRIITPYGLMPKVQADVFLKDSRLIIRPLRVTMGGGVAEVRATCQGKGKNLAVSGTVKIEELDLTSFLKELQTGDGADVTGAAEAELSTSGDSVRSLMANLNGKIIVTAGKGRIKNQFVRAVAGDLSTNILNLMGASSDNEEYTNVECAVCGLDIREGRARITSLVVDTPETTICGSGEVDLRTEQLDLSLEPLAKRGLAGLTLSLGELAKPFKLSGTLANPSLSVDPARTALTIGKAIAGVVLLGPLGIAGIFTGKTSEENPCAVAMEIARKGSKSAEMEREGMDGREFRKVHGIEDRAVP